MWRHILKLTSSPSEHDCVHITLYTKSDDNSAVGELRLGLILSFFPLTVGPRGTTSQFF